MYSTCLFCTKDLGKNEVIETLPVGRRVAFDAAQGRLWVVCRHCAKWNLVPFDTRLESIDAGERLFRDTRVRFSTDNIGIARLKEGLELVRIGPALRPEFAAWRYGDQFGRRRQQTILAGAGLVVVGVGIMVGGAALGIGAGAMPSVTNSLIQFVRDRRVVVRLPREDASPLQLTAAAAKRATLEVDSEGEWGVRVKPKPGRTYKNRNPPDDGLIVGADAERLLAGILAHANGLGGTSRELKESIRLVESTEDLPRQFAKLETEPLMYKKGEARARPRIWRLATEMALHEASERVALAGQLALLEWHWKEADRLAKISDSLALPESVEEELNDRRSSIDDRPADPGRNE